MPNLEARVQMHYGRSGLLERIEAGLRAANLDPLHPRVEDLHPFDQLHGRGIVATREHAARAGLRAGMHVLDLGCGLGGSSRYLVAACNCRVTAIDLTPEFVDVARLLTERCGLAAKIDYHQGSALALPFAAASFDHVWCHNVTMNIADRTTLARQVACVLRSGGRFSCVEIAQGGTGQPHFPLPWASDPAASFLATPEAMRAELEAAGLGIVKQHLHFGEELEKLGPPPHQAHAVTMGDDFAIRIQNVMSGVREGSLVDEFILAEKR
jgi:SAM-dependent methyltransferase